MWSLAGWFLPLGLASAASPTSAGLPLGNEANPYSAVVARMVRAIVQYSQWPDDQREMRACVVGPTDHADDLLAGKDVAALGVSVAKRSIDTASADTCEIIYLGRLALDDQRLVTARVRGQAVLTIAENDPACRSRAMFCLLFEADALSFRLNIDSVANSQVRIDPRVLRLGAGGTS